MRNGIKFLAVLFAVTVALSSTPAFAKKDGDPSGWAKGEKTGWQGESTPPGLGKKEAKKAENKTKADAKKSEKMAKADAKKAEKEAKKKQKEAEKAAEEAKEKAEQAIS